MPLGRLVLRLARRHRGRQAPRGARAATELRGQRRPGQRARRLPALPGDLRRRALRRAARGRRPRPAPAVGLDRRRRTRDYPDDACTSTASSAPRHGQHDADGDAAGLRRARSRSSGGDGRSGPDATDLAGARRRRHRHGRRHRQAAARRHRRVRRRRWTSCSRASRPSARASSPGARRRSTSALPDELRAGDRRAGRAGRRAEDVAERIWSKDETLWGGARRARGRRPPRLADDQPSGCARTPTTCARSRPAARPTGSPTRAARHGRLVARARGLPAQRSATPASCACTCSTRPTPARCARSSARSTWRTRCSSSRRSPAGRSRRCSHFRYFWERQRAATARASSRSPTRARSLEELGRASTASARVFENDPDIGGRYSALSYFGLVPAALIGRRRRRRCSTAPRSAEQRVRERRRHERNSGPVARLRARRAGARQGRDKLTFVVDEPIARFGLWVEQLVAESTGQAGQGHPAGRRRAARRAGGYGDDRVFLHLRNPDEPDAELDGELAALGRAGPPDADARPRTAPRTSAGSSSSPSSPPPSPAGRSSINPFDQPNVQEAKDKTDDGARARRRRRSPEADRRRPARAARARGAAALRGDPRLTSRPSRRGRRRGRASCARAIRDTTTGDDDVRLRPALPALDRAAPQGRPADGPLPRSCSPTATATSRSPGAVHLRAAQARPGDRRPADAARRTACPAEQRRRRRRRRRRRSDDLDRTDC